MICAKTVLPRYTRYSGSKARSVHPSTFAVQVGDTPNGSETRMNNGSRPDTRRFNRTVVHFSHLARNWLTFCEKAVGTFRYATFFCFEYKTPTTAVRYW